MTVYNVSSGQTSSGIVLNSGDAENVSSGGTADSTTINDGGNAWVSSGGEAINTLVDSGGTQIIYGGTVIDTTVESGGLQTADGDCVDSDTTVDAGGVEIVYTAAVISPVVNSGGALIVAADGPSGATIDGGGNAVVYYGGTAHGTTVARDGVLVVNSGGAAYDTTVDPGGYLIVLPGASVSGTSGAIVSTGFALVEGTAGVTSLGSLATNIVVSGAPWLGGSTAQLFSAATVLYVLPGGSAAGVTAGSGGLVEVASGGVAVATDVAAGGSLSAESGGTVVGTFVDGGSARIGSGATASFTVVTSGSLAVLSGATATDVNVNGGFLYSDGSLGGLIVAGGGIADVGTVDSAVVQGGGTISASASQATQVGSGGTEVLVGYVDRGEVIDSSVASGTVLGSGGVQIVSTGGFAYSTFVSDGGRQVANGGIALATSLGSGGTLMVSGGGAVGTIINDGASAMVLVGNATGIIVSSGGTLTEAGIFIRGSGYSSLEPATVAGTTISGGGSVIVSAYASDTSATVLEGGRMTLLTSGVAFNATVEGGGILSAASSGWINVITLAEGGQVEVGDGAVVHGPVVFAGGSAELTLGAFVDSAGSFYGFAATDRIDLADMPYDPAGSATLLAGNRLAIVESATTLDLQLNPHANYGAATFSLASASGLPGTVLTTDAAPCLRAGTLIRTDRGEVPVEALQIGDRLVLARGGTAAVRWLGYRRVDCRRHRNPHDVWPVRVAAGAFSAERPRRDLFLSPDHAVFVGGVLIPIRYLVNGATIAQTPVEQIAYWHVELPDHGVLLAEGLPCESYLDTGNRGAFANGGGTTMLHAEFARAAWAARGCAPLVLAGPALVETRRRLLARAVTLGHKLTRDPALSVTADDVPLLATTAGAVRDVCLPRGTRELRLISRTWVPANTCADQHDTRALGIALSQLWLDGREASLTSPALTAGWHEPEQGLRWTTGDARIAVGGVRRLALKVAMTGSYWLRPVRRLAECAHHRVCGAGVWIR